MNKDINDEEYKLLEPPIIKTNIKDFKNMCLEHNRIQKNVDLLNKIISKVSFCISLDNENG